jgi:hypothetical protein
VGYCWPRSLRVGIHCRNQLTLENQSHGRHPHIKNQPGRIMQLIGIQKRFRRRETLCPKSDGSDQIVKAANTLG